MQLSENQATEVKEWVVKKLEDISDADSDVLADYVLALIRSDAPDDAIRKASVENLEDFLREHTTQFVDELFATFGPKQSPPSQAHFQTQPQLPQDIPPSSLPQQPLQFDPSSGPPSDPYSLPMGMPQQQSAPDGGNYNRKRSFHEGFEADQGNEEVPYNRAFKTPRRGRGGGRGDWMGRDGRAPQGGINQYPPQAPGFPMMPSAFPPFNQNDPMGAMMALQGMGFPQMPGMPPMPMPPPGQQPDQMGPKSGERCPFYETQGICYLGSTCPYQHGPEAGGATKDDEYDPKTSNIVMDIQRRGDGHMRGSDRGRGRGRGDRGGFKGRGHRSEFSAFGPNEDTTITTIVVEQIPEDKLDEATVREFFSQYGEIVDVSLQPRKKLALITYDTHASAKQAWSSPKVIFDNRFVKVYWYKPNQEKNGDRPPSGEDQGMTFNREEFEKQQEEAQKAYDEKRKKREETEQAKQALDKQREELLAKQQEEKDKLLQRLGAQDSNGAASAEAPEAGTGDDANDQTKQLRAKLASLEAEAKSLGIDPNSADTGSYGYRGRGRGYYRGRGGFAPRGRGYDPSYRGGYRGRGAFRGRGGVLRLDNRPKRIAVSGVEFNSEKDEALRQFLIGVGEYESIEPHSEDPSSLVVAFKERYQAEKFMRGPWAIPAVGEVQLSWVPNPPVAPTPSDAKTGSDEDVTMDATTTTHPPQDQLGVRKDGNHEVDYDVAEVDDSWGVE